MSEPESIIIAFEHAKALSRDPSVDRGAYGRAMKDLRNRVEWEERRCAHPLCRNFAEKAGDLCSTCQMIKVGE